MRATIPIAIVVGFASAAHADARADVDAVVRAQLGAIGVRPITDTLAKGATVWVQNHALDASDDAPTYESWISGGNAGGGVTVAVGAPLVIGVDEAAKVAWFHAGALTLKHREDGAVKAIAVRAVGVLVVEGGAWKVAVASYTTTMPDAALVAYAQADDVEPATSAPPKIVGDAAIGKAAAAWFSAGAGSGLVKGASATSKQIAASGTSVGEVAVTPAAASKLAKTWDAAKIGAMKIEAKAYGGRFGFVHVDARMPVPVVDKTKGTRAADIELFGIARDEGAAGWRWVALSWQP